MSTVEALLSVGVGRLRAAEIRSDTPRLDAELLLAHVLGTDRTTILAHPEAPVGDTTWARYAELLGRREAGEPVAYIRGMKEFRGLAFSVDARALIPRPETELLVELAETEIIDRLTVAPRPPGSPPLAVLDVGTGSGAVAIAIAVDLRRRRMLDDVEIRATDASEAGVQLARENAVAHAVADRVVFEVADLLPVDVPAGGAWSVVAANLPYVPTATVPTLPRATSYEPLAALDGGPDGLAVIGRLLDRLPGALAPDGIAVLEIGADQRAAITELVGARLPGWSIDIRNDLASLPRVALIGRA